MEIEGTKIVEAVNLAQTINEPIVILSYFPDAIRQIEKLLESTEKTFITTLADMDTSQRFENMKIFQSGEADIYLSTIGIAKVGIQLDRANTLFFIDGTYVPADMLQAARRIMNPDKSDPISIYHFLSHGTFDTRIWDARNNKQMSISFWIDRELPDGEDKKLGNAMMLDALKEEFADV